ncbi:MAG: Ni/Fe hydrogenase subunit alpha [Armatimonadetes bacterium]|nr:Ni/Fe hydrogenase subunit alpha [Armatimonadota bacterium]
MRNATNEPETRSIQVDYLARVEGEGALHLTLQDGRVTDARLRIFEPPRFYEAFLRGRDFREVPDITARICGICPVAHQMSSCHALEQAMGVTHQIEPSVRALRNLLYCGEWIESHALHIFLLHLPDFLGYESAITMAADHAETVKRALRIKKLGNTIVSTLAGREVHPINACVGGFYRAPTPQELMALVPEIEFCLEEMCDLTLFLAATLEYPKLDQDYEFVALSPDDEYPINLGPIASSKGFRVQQQDYLNAVEEQHVPHSTALHSMIKGRGPYHIGPLARLNLNADKLHQRAADLVASVSDAVGHGLPWRNSFLSLPARALETVHALALSLEIIKAYRPPARAAVPIRPRAGVGAAATEAPRGINWHRYETDSRGLITAARIMSPTAQNQAQIEADLRKLAPQIVSLDDEKLTLACEHLIRNYDPCISCSTHFLRVHIERIAAPLDGA